MGLLEQVLSTCRELIWPLVRADGGELYVVSVTADDIHIHLAGTCAGCPGATFTGERLVEPLVKQVAPKATVRITTGWQVPDGAQRVE